jgi:hypothetical protein
MALWMLHKGFMKRVQGTGRQQQPILVMTSEHPQVQQSLPQRTPSPCKRFVRIQKNRSDSAVARQRLAWQHLQRFGVVAILANKLAGAAA